MRSSSSLTACRTDLRVGLFAQPRTYKARIRFANATSQSDNERDVRGMSIKVSDAASENLTAGRRRITTSS